MDNLLPFQRGFVFSPNPPQENVNLFTASTESACEAARDAYFSANPSALDAYINNATRIIQFTVEGPTETTFLYQAHLNGEWKSVLGFGETQGGGGGDVNGPAISTPTALPRWDDATGTLLSDSAVLSDGTNVTYKTPSGGVAGSEYRNSADLTKATVKYSDIDSKLEISADGATNGIDISSGDIGTRVISDGDVLVGGSSTRISGNALTLQVGPAETPLITDYFGDGVLKQEYASDDSPEGVLTADPYSVCFVKGAPDPDNNGYWVLNSPVAANTPWIPVGTIGGGGGGGFTGVTRQRNELVFTGAGGATVIIPDIAEATTTFGGSVIIDRDSSGTLVRFSAAVTAVTSSAVNMFEQGAVFALDLIEKPSSVLFSLQDTVSSIFENGSTSTWLRGGEISVFKCFLEDPALPQSATNPLVYKDFSPVRKINRTSGPWSGPNNLVINNVSEARILFGEAFSGDIVVETDPVTFTHKSVFSLDLKSVPASINFTLEDTIISEIQGGLPTVVIPPFSVVEFECLLPDPLQPQSPTNKLVYYYTVSSESLPLPAQRNTIYVNPNEGGLIENGLTRATAFSAFQDALNAAATIPQGQEKQIVCEDLNALPNFTNNAGTNNIQNLYLDAPKAQINNISTDNFPSFMALGRVTGNVLLQSGSSLEVATSIGVFGGGTTFTFGSQAHLYTYIKCRQFLSPLDFTGIAVGSIIIVEIDVYTDPLGAVATIPGGVSVQGHIGDLTLRVPPP